MSWHASLKCHGSSEWIWLRLEIKQNHCSILKKVVICYQLKPDIQVYGHRSRYTADAEAVRDWLVCSKVPGCWLMISAASLILFRINWWCVNQVFIYVAFLKPHWPAQICWSAWHDGSPLNQCACELFLIILVAHLESQFFEGWTQTLTSVHTVLKLTSTWIASPGPNLPTFTWCTVQHMATAGKHGVYHEHFPKHCVLWLSYICFCLLWPMGNRYICSEHAQHGARTISWHFWAYTSIPAALLSAVYVGWWLCVWTSDLKWYKIWLNFGIFKWFCFISNLSQTHFVGTWHSKNTRPAYNCLIINLWFGPSHQFMKSGHGVFPHLYMASNIMFYHDFEDFLYYIFGTDMQCIIEAESSIMLVHIIHLNMTAFFSWLIIWRRVTL